MTTFEKKTMQKYILIYFILVLVFAAIFFLIPINLFDGEIHYQYDLVDYKVKQKLSLSYFIGIGSSPSDLKGVKDFYLLPLGYFMTFLMLFLFPGIIAYRLYLKNLIKK